MFTASDAIYRQPHCIIDPAIPAETARLGSQHTAIYTCLDLLPILPQEVDGLRLLDLACATGDWLLDAANALPEASVAGIDPSAKNIEYAHMRARVGLRHNICCEQMALSEQLHLPLASFHLVYGSFLSTWLDRQEWLPILVQCRSLLQPDGVLRLVEAPVGHCSSPACEQLSQWYQLALQHFGVRPVCEYPDWGHLLEQAGYDLIERREEALDFSVGSVAHSRMRHVICAFLWLVRPFVLKSGVVTEKIFQQTYELMCCEIESEGFSGYWQFIDLRATLKGQIQR